MNPLRYIEHWLWQRDESTLPPLQHRVLPLLRFVYALAERLVDGDLSLRAQSLVYTTLLSLVPLMAVSFSVLKAFDVHTQLQPLLLGLVEPLGDNGPEVVARLIAFVENMKVGVLGFVGLAMLFYTVVSTLHKIESAFNSIWHNIKPRSMLRRFTDYTSVLLVGPVLIVAGLGMTASMTSTRFVQSVISIEPFGTAYYYFGLLMPYVLITAAFYFVYIFMPNTKVRARAAFFGALVAGTLWKTAGWGFATFVASSTQYHAVYSGMAIVLIFMIWVYVSWLIVLLGAQIAFYVQNPAYLLRHGETGDAPSSAVHERVALAIMVEIAQRFHAGTPAPDVEMMSQKLALPPNVVDAMLHQLHAGRWVVESDDDMPAYVPARDLATLRLDALLASIRGDDVPSNNWDVPPAALTLHNRVKAGIAAGLADTTLADVVESQEA